MNTEIPVNEKYVPENQAILLNTTVGGRLKLNAGRRPPYNHYEVQRTLSCKRAVQESSAWCRTDLSKTETLIRQTTTALHLSDLTTSSVTRIKRATKLSAAMHLVFGWCVAAAGAGSWVANRQAA
jgi:hypothetical protein